MKKIMLVDDAEDIREVLSLYLENAGYEIIEAGNGLEALEKLENEEISLMILDIMMPGMDGYELIKTLGKDRYFPVIFLSAKTTVQDKIQGLNLGGDDYIAKPFDPGEVLARVMAVLRRSPIKEEKTFIVNGLLKWDVEKRLVYLNDENLEMTAKEYLLLTKFMEKPGKVFTKSEIYEDIWKEPYYFDDNTIMVHISKLREKIGPDLIKTIRGIGYMMVELNDEKRI